MPKTIDGQLVTRVAMGMDVLARLHQLMLQVLRGVRDAGSAKGENRQTTLDQQGPGVR